MVIEKRTIDIPLYGGIDTKTVDKSVPSNRTLVLENAVMKKTGEIKKRNGYEHLGQGTFPKLGTYSASSLDTINSIHAFNDTLVVIGSDESGLGRYDNYKGPGVFSYIKDENKWINNGYYFPCTFSLGYSTGAKQTVINPNLSEGNGHRLYTYEDDAIAFWDIADKKTGTMYRESLTIEQPAVSPKSFYIEDGYGRHFIALASSPTTSVNPNIHGQIIPADTPYYNGTNFDAISDYDSPSGLWDGCKAEYDGYDLAVIAYRRTNGRIGVKAFNGQGDTVKSLIIEVLPKDCITIEYIDHTDITGYHGRYYLLYRDEVTGDVDGYVLNDDLVVTHSQASVEPTFFDDDQDADGVFDYKIKNITVAKERAGFNATGLDADQPFSRVFIESEGDWGGAENTVQHQAESKTFVHTTKIDYSGVKTGIANQIYGVGLYSKAFYYNKHCFFLGVHESGLQNTYFLITVKDEVIPDAVTVAKILYGKAQGLRSHNLAEVIETSTGNFTTMVTRETRLLSNGVKETQAVELKLNLNPEAIKSVQVGKSMLMGGGVIGTFDRVWQEHGFPIYPENIELNPAGASTTGGEMGDGYRSYRVVYSWVDRQGQKQLSAPSEAIGRTYDKATDTQADTITCNQHYRTDFNNKGWWSLVDIYRTVAGGSTFHLVAKDRNINDFSSKEFTSERVGNETDVSIQDNEILYTDGGALPNIAPPASNIMAVSKDRAFLVPMDDPEAVWFSKQKVEGYALEFSDELIIRVEKGGSNTGIATMDDKLIIFKEREIYFLAGDGPNDAGSGSFSAVRQISSDVGCVDSASTINIGIGVMFKSHKGIYIIDRSLQVSYIGAAVEEWNKYKVVNAEIIEDQNQVRFMLEKGAGLLVYDYFHNQWTRFTNYPGSDAVVFNGVYHWVRNDGIVRRENDGFADENFKVKTRVRTSWMKLDGMQGYQRVRKAYILGDYKSPHSLVCKIYTDYDDVNVSQTVTIASSDAMLGNEPLQYEIHIKDQKCQAIMFEIYDSKQDGLMESFTLTSIALDVSVKNGMNKLPPRKRD